MLKAPTQNTITLGNRALPQEFWGGHVKSIAGIKKLDYLRSHVVQYPQYKN